MYSEQSQATFFDNFDSVSNFPSSSPELIIGFKNRKYALGMSVRGYRDLNSKNSELFSIQGKGGPLSGKVLDHSVSVVIENAIFNVRAGGQRRTRVEKRRCVHAFVEGQLAQVKKDKIKTLSNDWIEVTYNPFYTDTFIEKSSARAVFKAKKAILQQGSVWCQGVSYAPQPE